LECVVTGTRMSGPTDEIRLARVLLEA
jgi:hypothetical protein